MLTTCHDVFNTARAKRADYPLTHGQYKLDEARKNIERWRDLVIAITERVQTGGKFGVDENLGPCMADERASYLTALPALIAELIGYKILPAIAALQGDGVPKAEVKRLIRLGETDAQRILTECEAVRMGLKGGIEREYFAMRRGKSRLMAVLDDTCALATI